jgi:hypothetical protein
MNQVEWIVWAGGFDWGVFVGLSFGLVCGMILMWILK